jgi:hypothetical protein
MFRIRLPSRLAALTAATAIAASGLAYGVGVDTAAAEPSKGGGSANECPDGQVKVGVVGPRLAGWRVGLTAGIEGIMVPYLTPVYEYDPLCLPKPPAPKK